MVAQQSDKFRCEQFVTKMHRTSSLARLNGRLRLFADNDDDTQHKTRHMHKSYTISALAIR